MQVPKIQLVVISGLKTFSTLLKMYRQIDRREKRTMRVEGGRGSRLACSYEARQWIHKFKKVRDGEGERKVKK